MRLALPFIRTVNFAMPVSATRAIIGAIADNFVASGRTVIGDGSRASPERSFL
jgi:hypothetical protein